jgi:tetratricopeptide (TPR) repeat protein
MGQFSAQQFCSRPVGRQCSVAAAQAHWRNARWTLRRHTPLSILSHFGHMKLRQVLLFPFVLTLLWGAPIADPEAVLKDLVARQQALFEEAAKEDPNFDVENFRSQLQQICNEYDLLLKDHPKFAPAYVGYGMLLTKVDMRKEGAQMFLRANALDKNIPLVKNQLGNYLAEEGKPLEAANYFLSAIQLAPKEPLYHYQLGTLLHEARDDFLKSGNWTREALDNAMQEAFRQAMELTPGNIGYAYRFGESYYDLEQPEWEEALEFWKSLELKVSPGVEKQTVRLHQANIFFKMGKADEANAILETVTEPVLQRQKQKLVAEQSSSKPE